MPFTANSSTDSEVNAIMQGFSSAGRSIQDATDTYIQNKKERDNLTMAAEGILKTYAADPEFQNVLGDQMPKIHSMSTGALRGFVGTAGGLLAKKKNEMEQKLQTAQLAHYNDLKRKAQWEMDQDEAFDQAAPEFLKQYNARVRGQPASNAAIGDYYDKTATEPGGVPGVDMVPGTTMQPGMDPLAAYADVAAQPGMAAVAMNRRAEAFLKIAAEAQAKHDRIKLAPGEPEIRTLKTPDGQSVNFLVRPRSGTEPQLIRPDKTLTPEQAALAAVKLQQARENILKPYAKAVTDQENEVKKLKATLQYWQDPRLDKTSDSPEATRNAYNLKVAQDKLAAGQAKLAEHQQRYNDHQATASAVEKLMSPSASEDAAGEDAAGGEVERVTKDGRTAVYDSTTKKFLRFKTSHAN